MIPEEFMIKYNPYLLVHNGYIYGDIHKGMYGLPQTGRISHDRLPKHLKRHDYLSTPITAGLWHHKTQPINFTLVVDDFGVKYVGRERADHLKMHWNQYIK